MPIIVNLIQGKRYLKIKIKNELFLMKNSALTEEFWIFTWDIGFSIVRYYIVGVLLEN